MSKLNYTYLSIEDCYKILNKNGNLYTKEEVIKCRDFIYNLVEIFNELEQD